MDVHRPSSINNSNNLILIARKFTFEYDQMRVTKDRILYNTYITRVNYNGFSILKYMYNV
jgi:hypothetical protein